jgi:hypothetical protein
MNLLKKLNAQTKIALIFTLVLLLVIGGGIIAFIILSNFARDLPGFTLAEKLGPDLYGALARTRLTLTYLLFIEVLLLLPLGIGLIRTVGPLLKKDGEETPFHNTSNLLPPRFDEPSATPVLEEIGALTNQMAEAARKANEVMVHSQAAIKKGIVLSEATLEALKENKKLTLKVTQLIESLTGAFQTQPQSFH